MVQIKLYSYYRSSATYRVRIALALKNLTYEYVPIALMKDGGEQHSSEYSIINAMNQVPTIVIDGVMLTQSLPIVEYIDEKFHDGAKLLPGTAEHRANARQIAEIINSGIQPLQNLTTLNAVKVDKMVWAHDVIDKGFKAVENLLAKTAGKYCVGDHLSLADICLVPQVYNALRFKVNMEQFPLISRINETCCLLDAVKIAMPKNQPDCPEEDK